MKPLDGLKVLDLTWVVAGPVVTRALADFGATVVRLESSKRVDAARLIKPFIGGTFSTENSALYSTWNAGKLGITVNLQEEEGRQIVRDLAKWADVVLESFSPGAMAKWGLGYDVLSQGRDDLIMVSSAIYGQTGPVSRLAGYGNVGAALSGFQQIVGAADRLPFGPFGPYTDFVAPRMALTLLLAAIENRHRTGKGCYIDVAQVEAGVFFQSPELAAHFSEGFVADRMGNEDREFAPHGVYRAKDEIQNGHTTERHVAIVITSDEQWPRLAVWLGRSDLSTDDKLRDVSGRQRRRAEINAAIADVTSTRVAKDIEAELQQLGIPAHVSANSVDFCSDQQLQHRDHLVTLPHELFGTVVVEGPRYKLSATPGGPERAAPTLGQDNKRVLVEIAGYDERHIHSLEERGILK